MSQAKPVDLFVIDNFKLEGKHVEVGQVLLSVEAELAKELAGAGRARVATDDEIKASKAKAAKAAKAETAPA